ncbi:unnamed protein product [Rangifer tarandus platyrhynchus]|uniref:Uncharacterized protein n=1 Tax=Rangifer tarandus platyrhynchus TaxID=3082113 RepID=A0AC59ZQZ9_RANTA
MGKPASTRSPTSRAGRPTMVALHCSISVEACPTSPSLGASPPRGRGGARWSSTVFPSCARTGMQVVPRSPLSAPRYRWVVFTSLSQSSPPWGRPVSPIGPSLLPVGFR